jgi:hypothetical protein
MSVKKWLALGVLGFAAIAAFAGTCTIVNIRMTEVNGKAVFGGEIQNDSGADFLQHNIIVAFVNDDNEVIETKNVSGCLRTLLDGGSNYFSATSTADFDDVKAALSRLAFDGTLKAGEPEQGDVMISNLTIYRVGNDLTVTGKIKNEDNDKLYDPAVCVVVRDDDGNIVIVGRTTSISDLEEEGETGDEDDFIVEMKVPDSTTIVNEIDVHVDGLEGGDGNDGTPIEPISDVDNDVSLNTPTPTRTATVTGTPPTSTATATATATATP